MRTERFRPAHRRVGSGPCLRPGALPATSGGRLSRPWGTSPEAVLADLSREATQGPGSLYFVAPDPGLHRAFSRPQWPRLLVFRFLLIVRIGYKRRERKDPGPRDTVCYLRKCTSE